MNDVKIIDRHNRQLSYLRVSITDRCNLECVYCNPDNLNPKLPHDEILRYEEILRIIKVGVRLGISKVRVTGGEPLVRKGVYDFLKKLVNIEGIRDVSLTTNGALLKNNIEKIKSAGIKRINISLDTLKREKYKEITGMDSFLQAWEGIESAQKAGLSPIKINVVALNGINDDELKDIAQLSFRYPFHIRFIEYMPIGTQLIKDKSPLLAPEILKRIESLGQLQPIANESYDGPAKRFKFEGALGEIGIISSISHHFCETCNRLRLTASGKLRSCLLADYHQDLLTPLRKGCTDNELANIFLKAASHKPFKHKVVVNQSTAVKGNMSSIGG
ncbi:MAG: GTP 3',8-cyclase MoaA [Desulfobacterales bacterium]|nr:GTP 3',8-cyclase MoaA [Desulfobacterales bacterium]